MKLQRSRNSFARAAKKALLSDREHGIGECSAIGAVDFHTFMRGT